MSKFQWHSNHRYSSIEGAWNCPGILSQGSVDDTEVAIILLRQLFFHFQVVETITRSNRVDLHFLGVHPTEWKTARRDEEAKYNLSSLHNPFETWSTRRIAFVRNGVTRSWEVIRITLHGTPFGPPSGKGHVTVHVISVQGSKRANQLQSPALLTITAPPLCRFTPVPLKSDFSK